LWSCITAQRNEEGDGVAAIAFFFFFGYAAKRRRQQRYCRLLLFVLLLRIEKGDGSFVAVTFSFFSL